MRSRQCHGWQRIKAFFRFLETTASGFVLEQAMMIRALPVKRTDAKADRLPDEGGSCAPFFAAPDCRTPAGCADRDYFTWAYAQDFGRLNFFAPPPTVRMDDFPEGSFAQYPGAREGLRSGCCRSWKETQAAIRPGWPSVPTMLGRKLFLKPAGLAVPI